MALVSTANPIIWGGSRRRSQLAADNEKNNLLKKQTVPMKYNG
jgi:hypothetical protein